MLCCYGRTPKSLPRAVSSVTVLLKSGVFLIRLDMVAWMVDSLQGPSELNVLFIVDFTALDVYGLLVVVNSGFNCIDRSFVWSVVL